MTTAKQYSQAVLALLGKDTTSALDVYGVFNDYLDNNFIIVPVQTSSIRIGDKFDYTPETFSWFQTIRIHEGMRVAAPRVKHYEKQFEQDVRELIVPIFKKYEGSALYIRVPLTIEHQLSDMGNDYTLLEIRARMRMFSEAPDLMKELRLVSRPVIE